MLNYWTDEFVGFSVCNGKQAIYVPVNHKSSLYNNRLPVQITEDQVRELFRDVVNNRTFKWVKIGSAI